MFAFILALVATTCVLTFSSGTCTLRKDSPNLVCQTAEDAIVECIAQSGWKRVIVLTDKDVLRRTMLLKLSSMLVESLALVFYSNERLRFQVTASILSTHSHQNIVVWCDVACQVDVIEMMAQFKMFGKRFTWLFILNSKEGINHFLQVRLLNENVSPISNIFALVLSETEPGFVNPKLIGLQHSHANSLDCIKSIKQHELNTRIKSDEGLNSYPLKGYDFRIGVVHVPPHARIQRKDSNVFFSGFHIEVMKVIAEYLGFTYKFEAESSGFGALKDGNWTGLVGNIMRQHYNFSGNGLILTTDRLLVVDFSQYIEEFAHTTLTRQPHPEDEYNLSAYISPFLSDLWFTYVTACLITLTLLALTSWCTDNLSEDDLQTTPLYWLWITTILRTDAAETPNKRSSQTLLLVLAYLVIFIYSCYSSLLTSNLTVRPKPKMYNDLDELINDGQYGISITDKTAAIEMLKNAKRGPLQRIWNKIKSEPGSLLTSFPMGYKKVLNEEYVFLSTEGVVTDMVLNSNCTMTAIREKYMSVTLHFSFPKHSPLAEIFSLKSLSIRSSGVLKKLKEKTQPTEDSSACESTSPVAVSLKNSVGAFLVLWTGMFLAAFCLLLEKLYESRF